MSKPVIFTISAAWDHEAAVWTGHCDDIPAAADAPTLDELLAKISAMALDLLSDNHPNVDPASLYLQITALREAEPAAAMQQRKKKQKPLADRLTLIARDLLAKAGPNRRHEQKARQDQKSNPEALPGELIFDQSE